MINPQTALAHDAAGRHEPTEAASERLAALVRAHVVERRVHRDPVEPREEVGSPVEAAEALERADERLLGDVVGVAVIAEDMECGGVHASLIAAHEAGKGLAIALTGAREVIPLVSHAG